MGWRMDSSSESQYRSGKERKVIDSEWILDELGVVDAREEFEGVVEVHIVDHSVEGILLVLDLDCIDAGSFVGKEGN